MTNDLPERNVETIVIVKRWYEWYRISFEFFHKVKTIALNNTTRSELDALREYNEILIEVHKADQAMLEISKNTPYLKP